MSNTNQISTTTYSIDQFNLDRFNFFKDTFTSGMKVETETEKLNTGVEVYTIKGGSGQNLEKQAYKIINPNNPGEFYFQRSCINTK